MTIGGRTCSIGIGIAARAGLALAIWPAMATSPAEEVQHVPGFADFLAVDGATVWATNRGRVERWSRNGKLAEVPLGRPCGAMAIAAGSLWVADCSDRTLNRIDIRSGTKTAAIRTGIANPAGELNVVAGAGSIWVASEAKGVITRVDPGDNSIVASVAVEPDTYYLSFGMGFLWAASPTRQTLQKIDPRTNAVVKTLRIGRQPGFLVAGAGAVWVQEQGDGTVVRIDPRAVEVTGRVRIDASLKYGDIDVGGGRVWLRTTAGQTFVVLDAKSMRIAARVGAASGSGALRYTRTGLWTTAHDVHTLTWWRNPGTIGSSAARATSQ